MVVYLPGFLELINRSVVVYLSGFLELIRNIGLWLSVGSLLSSSSVRNLLLMRIWKLDIRTIKGQRENTLFLPCGHPEREQKGEEEEEEGGREEKGNEEGKGKGRGRGRAGEGRANDEGLTLETSAIPSSHGVPSPWSTFWQLNVSPHWRSQPSSLES